VGAESSLPWADRIFGSDAADLRQVVVKALAAACSQSQGAQDVSRARKKYPFGSSLWTLQFQELADRIAVKLPDRHRLEELDSYSLAIVDNYVLYPVRSVNVKSVRAQDAKVRKPVSKLRRQMFAALGPEPYQPGLWPEQPAEEAAKDMRTLITRLGPDTHLAVISYVCDYKAGLTDIYWGEAELHVHDGALTFHDGEDLPLASTALAAPSQRSASDSTLPSRTFDGGDLPEIPLGVNPSHQAPVTEPEQPQPRTSDEEE
jgi:hypothetical protein